MSSVQPKPPLRPDKHTIRFLGYVIVAHLLLLGSIQWRYGILLDKEALKYTGCAVQVLHGDLTDLLGPYGLYASYVLFLTPFLAMGLPELAVIAQVVLGVFAALALRGIVGTLGGNRTQANLAFAVFLLLYPIQTWTLSLYSESFFVSISVLFLRAAMRRPWKTLPALALALVLLFARPMGVLFVVPVLTWYFAERLGMRPMPWVRLTSAAVLVAVLFLPVLDLDLLQVVVEGHAIGGIPQWPDAGASFHGTTLMAAEMQVITDHGAWNLVHLFGQRVAWLLFAGRPYYSVFHNALLAPVALIHPFAVAGMYHKWKQPVTRVLLLILALNIAVVGLTFAEWNGRFLVPMLPLLIALASVAMPLRREWT